jgi:solute carrier family 25 S-adenosylmethionine transporter 26
MEHLVTEEDPKSAGFPPLWVSLAAGGVAGTFTDITMFPLDTVKTRLQSGSSTSGIFRGMYQGLGPAALASAPSAALFFGTYEFAKQYVPETPFGHGQAAVAGEVVSALFKVPFEVVKQRLQASTSHAPDRAWNVVRTVYGREGVRGMYAGLGATLAREIPFGFIQMPVYEFLKKFVKKDGIELTTSQACGCGAVAGGLAAAATCPVDVWKTRLMLGDANASIWSIGKNEGIRALFSGVVPRVIWISVGGSVFFGAYEAMRSLLIRGAFIM